MSIFDDMQGHELLPREGETFADYKARVFDQVEALIKAELPPDGTMILSVQISCGVVGQARGIISGEHSHAIPPDVVQRESLARGEVEAILHFFAQVWDCVNANLEPSLRSGEQALGEETHGYSPN